MPQQVDAALQAFGFAMGPFRMYDVVGIDLEWRARQLAGQGMDSPLAQVDNALCERERFGQKTGRGYYRYAEGSREAEHDPQVDALIESIARELGYRRRVIDDQEIIERSLLALVNEGAKILRKTSPPTATTSIWSTSTVMASRRKWGPMNWADAQGLATIEQRLQALQQQHGEHWKPAALITRLVAAGKGLGNVGRGGYEVSGTIARYAFCSARAV